MAGYQGAMAAYKSGSQVLVTGRARDSWDEEIHKLNMKKAPLLYLLSQLKKREVDQLTFNWFNKERRKDQVAITAIGGAWASASASTGTFTVSTDDVWLFAETDLVAIPSVLGAATIYVTSVDQDTGIVTARPSGSTAIDLSTVGTNYPNVLLLSNVNETGTGKNTIKQQQPSSGYNYIQIVQTPTGITTTDQAAGVRGPNEYTEQLEEAGIDHAFKLEKTLFFGQRQAHNAGLDTGVYQGHMTGGLRGFISTNVHDQSGNLTKGDFSDWIDTWAKYAEAPVIIAGDLVYSGLAKWQESFVQTDAKNNVLGLHVNNFLTNKGKKIAVIPHDELFIGDLTGMAFGLDIPNLQYVYFKGLDTHLERDIQTPDYKLQEDEYRTWFGLQVNNEKQHGFLYGATGISLA